MTRVSQASADVLRILKDDHDTIRSLVAELHQERGGKRRRVVATLRREFLLHSEVEEQVVYPAYQDCVQSRQAHVDVEESQDEHRIVQDILRTMMAMVPDSVGFDAKLKLLTESIDHHITDEEENMLPQMREGCSTDRLWTLGHEVQQAKQALGRRLE